MTTPTERLYKLLPAVYKIRDAEQGEPLRQLLAVMDGPLGQVRDDIARLYDNWFIETCDEWVVPYIGDLLGVRGQYIFDNTTTSMRPFVANTLRYRRRKGTAAMLEGLALDVTGWPTRAVEFFELLATTQHLAHIRRIDLRTPDLRDTNALELLDGPFETTMHFAEVRRISTRQGKYNIGNVGLFVWRLLALPVELAPATPAVAIGPGRFRFDQLGADAVMFNRRPLTAPTAKAQLAPRVVESDMPGPLRMRALYEELEAARGTLMAGETPELHYFGAPPTLRVFAEGVEIPPDEVQICDLSDWTTLPSAEAYTLPTQPPTPKQTRIAVDPRTGRFAFLDGSVPKMTHVSYQYGTPAKIGGGSFTRPASAIAAPPKVYAVDALDPAALVDSAFTAALAQWVTDGRPSATFVFRGPILFGNRGSATFAVGDLSIPNGCTIVLSAGDSLRPLLHATAPWQITLAPKSTLVINGLRLAGNGLQLTTTGVAESEFTVAIEDCTLVPGFALDDTGAPLVPAAVSLAITAASIGSLGLKITRSIVGRIDASAGADTTLTIADSIVDGTGDVAPAIASANHLSVTRATVLGTVTTEILDASEAIFQATVTTTRTQVGCVRFSYVTPDSLTPRKYRCQPALAIEEAGTDAVAVQAVMDRLKPSFTSIHYNDPGYVQLASDCPIEIATGAEAGREMGAFQLLMQPQRLTNLQISLDEYLRFGLEAGVFQVT